MKVSLAQIAPIWLDKEKTKEKIKSYIRDAGKEKSDLIIFGEGLLPGYPFWLSMTNGSAFNSKVQKEIHAHYLRNAIQIEKGELDDICQLASENRIAIYLGIIERAKNRGGHSNYCSLVYIDKNGVVQSVHRKLQPTYEERLTWSHGDGHGLRTHELCDFTIGGLNCWENWMPLARTALYGMGENVHVAVWPGSERNTRDITEFIAKESRSFVISVSGLMRKKDFPENTPHWEIMMENCPDILADGGSCIMNPDGTWLVEPQVGTETLVHAVLDLQKVYEERQNFDPVGHYSRPDVLQLRINRERQSSIEIKD